MIKWSWGRNARPLQPRPIVKPWLLELETAKEILEGIFNARPADVEEMIHMVAASIATAYLHLTGQAAISLLTCPIFFELDRMRMADDYNPLSQAFADWPTRHAIYDNECKESDGLKHRRLDLEKLALELQVGLCRFWIVTIRICHRWINKLKTARFGDFPCIGWTCGIMILAKQ